MNIRIQGGIDTTGRNDGGPSPASGNLPINTLEALKRRWLGEALASVTEIDLSRRLQRAADEAASLAWATTYPLLALPELLVEKGREARLQFERQRAMQSRGRGITRLAA
jgi:hypothetical protein